MPAFFTTPQNRDLDDTFDSYLLGNKPGDTGFFINNYGDVQHRYAPRVFGQTAPATNFITRQGVDMNQLFAAKGTAGYLRDLNGIGDLFIGASGVTLLDLMASRIDTTIHPNGYYEVVYFTTNHKTDSPGAYAPPNRGITRTETNFSSGRLAYSGYWSQIVDNSVGNNYECYAIGPLGGSIEGGTIDHWNINNGADITFLPGNWKNMGNGQNGTIQMIQNTTTNVNYDIPDGRRYRINRPIKYSLGLTAQGGSNSYRFYDRNGALSWYNRCGFLFGINNVGGGQVIERAVTFTNEIRWNAWNWTGGSGSGSGGGGGCVDAQSWVTPTLQAGYTQAGDMLMGMTPEMEFMDLTLTSCRRERQPSVRLWMESGATLITSTSTPLTLDTGKCISIAEVEEGKTRLPVKHYSADPRWERIVRVEDVGVREVMVICVGGQNYAAGEQNGHFVYTHNATDAQQKI